MTDTSSDVGGRATPEQMPRKHVYVLNDSPDLLAVIRELLLEEHYTVTTGSVFTETFATVEAARPSMIILDLVHGEPAGWDLMTTLRQAVSTRDIPLLITSTLQEELDRANEQPAGVHPVRSLRKPFDLVALLAVIEELIGRA